MKLQSFLNGTFLSCILYLSYLYYNSLKELAVLNSKFNLQTEELSNLRNSLKTKLVPEVAQQVTVVDTVYNFLTDPIVLGCGCFFAGVTFWYLFPYFFNTTQVVISPTNNSILPDNSFLSYTFSGPNRDVLCLVDFSELLPYRTFHLISDAFNPVAVNTFITLGHTFPHDWGLFSSGDSINSCLLGIQNILDRPELTSLEALEQCEILFILLANYVN